MEEKPIQRYLKEIFGIINQLKGMEDKKDVLLKFSSRSFKYVVEEEPEVKSLYQKRNFWNFKDLLRIYRDYKKEWHPYHNILMRDHLERLIYGFVLGSYFEANYPEALLQFYSDFYEGVDLSLRKYFLEEIIKESLADENLKAEALKRIDESIKEYESALEYLKPLSKGLKEIKDWIKEGRIEDLRKWYLVWRRKVLLDPELQHAFFYLLPLLFSKYDSKKDEAKVKEGLLSLFSGICAYGEDVLKDLEKIAKPLEKKKVEEKVRVKKIVRKKEEKKIEKPKEIKERILELLKEKPMYAHEIGEVLNLEKEELSFHISELSKSGKIELEGFKWKVKNNN